MLQAGLGGAEWVNAPTSLLPPFLLRLAGLLPVVTHFANSEQSVGHCSSRAGSLDPRCAPRQFRWRCGCPRSPPSLVPFKSKGNEGMCGLSESAVELGPWCIRDAGGWSRWRECPHRWRSSGRWEMVRFGVQSRMNPHRPQHSLGLILLAHPSSPRDERGFSSLLLSMPSHSKSDGSLGASRGFWPEMDRNGQEIQLALK
jgi:hypothetical protein